MSFTDPRAQMARWLEVLCQYRFKIVHCSGKKHSNTDSLSRVPCVCVMMERQFGVTCHAEDVMCVRGNMNSGCATDGQES